MKLWLGKKVFEPLNELQVFISCCTVLNDTLAWDLGENRDPRDYIDIAPDCSMTWNIYPIKLTWNIYPIKLHDIFRSSKNRIYLQKFIELMFLFSRNHSALDYDRHFVDNIIDERIDLEKIVEVKMQIEELNKALATLTKKRKILEDKF